MDFPRFATAVVVCAALSACTSLTSHRDIAYESDQAVQGMRYQLPMRQYDIVVTRTLAQCQVTAGTTITDEVKFTTEVTVTPQDIAGESYILDYLALAGSTKTTGITIDTHESGTLKSLNADAKDYTGETLAASAKAIVGIASLASGVPVSLTAAGPNAAGTHAVPPAALIPTLKTLFCKDATKQSMHKVATLKTDLKRETDELSTLTEAISQLTERAALHGLSEAEKLKLSQLLDRHRAQAAAVESLQTALTKARAAFSVTQRLRWPLQMKQPPALLASDPEQIKRLADMLEFKNANSAAAGMLLCAPAQSEAECIDERLHVSASLDSIAPLASGTPCPPEKEKQCLSGVNTAEAKQGLYVRPPAPGVLTICSGQASGCRKDSQTFLYRSDVQAIPQLGGLLFLPFENRAFQNNTITLALRKDGSIEKFEYKTLKSVSEAMATSTADLVSQYGTFSAARDQAKADAMAAEKAQIAAQRKEETDSLQHQITLLTQQKQLAALQTPTDSSLTALQAETAATNARTALLQAQLAERKAQAALLD